MSRANRNINTKKKDAVSPYIEERDRLIAGLTTKNLKTTAARLAVLRKESKDVNIFPILENVTRTGMASVGDRRFLYGHLLNGLIYHYRRVFLSEHLHNPLFDEALKLTSDANREVSKILKKLTDNAEEAADLVLEAARLTLEAYQSSARAEVFEPREGTASQDKVADKSNTPPSPRLFATPEVTRKRTRHGAEDDKKFEPENYPRP